MATAIQTQITRLENVKADIASAIASKGVTVPSGAKLDDYADLIRSISSMSDIILPNAGSHNSIYRGKNLGSSVTTAQWNAIRAGTFDDLYIGDYWVINSVNWRIAAFDYYYNIGSSNYTTHHAVIVPDSILDTNRMTESGTNDTSGGYDNSLMRTTNIATSRTKVAKAFGSGHIMWHMGYLISSATDGVPTDGAFKSVDLIIMTEANVFGSAFFSTMPNGSSVLPDNRTVDSSQFPLFAFNHSLIVTSARDEYWLRDIATSAMFVAVSNHGTATPRNSGGSRGVRPSFCIKG